MSRSIRRITLILVGLAVMGGVALLNTVPAEAQIQRQAQGQPGQPGKQGQGQPGQPGQAGQPRQGQPGQGQPGQAGPGIMARWDYSAQSQIVTLPTDPGLKKKFDAIPDYINEELWSEVVKSLQSLLETKEDVFVPMPKKAADGKDTYHWRSVRAEANRMLGTLPPKALEFYEVAFGQTARASLNEAKQRNDPHLLAQVSQRYFHTVAGAEATALLGSYHLDRGRYLMAALCFERHLQRVGIDKLSALDLFRASLAFHRAGDRANADLTWKRLTEKAPDGLQIGDRKVALAELEKALGKPGELALEQGPARDSMMFRGGPTRTAHGQGNAPAGEVQWSQVLFQDTTVGDWVVDAVRQQEARGQAALPGSFPITSGDRVVYRTLRGVRAVDAGTGDLLWESSSDGSLEQLRGEPDHSPYITQWVNSHLQNSPNTLLENSLLGTLSTNGSLVFTVDDLAVPPLPNNYQGFVGRQGQALKLAFAPEMTDAIYHNRLRALDLQTGKIVWEVGQRAAQETAGNKEADSPLLDSYFLGPPLPLGGKLYALTEKNQELRLLCLDAGRGDVSWSQLLATVPKKLLVDSSRRVHAAHLACGEGILVCPTNAGALIGVDLLTHSLVWAYVYREEPPKPELPPGVGRPRAPRNTTPPKPPPCDADWRGAAPLVHKGKVIHAAPDDPAIHCLNLRDGSMHWTFQRSEPNLYLAGVYQDLLLVVSKQEVLAISLETGRELWKVDVGPVSGHGVIAGDVCYVPVKTDGPTPQGAICAVDLVQGVLQARTPTPKNEVAGNLVFHDGKVLSQTATTLTAYSQAKRDPDEKQSGD